MNPLDDVSRFIRAVIVVAAVMAAAVFSLLVMSAGACLERGIIV